MVGMLVEFGLESEAFLMALLYCLMGFAAASWRIEAALYARW